VSQAFFLLATSALTVLFGISNQVDGAILIFAEDDKVWYRDSEARQPRDNVLVEYGVFASTIGRHNVIIALHQTPRVPTDIAGITHIDASRAERARAEIKLWLSRLGRTASVPNMAGRWLYDGGTDDGGYKVQGECNIEQMGRQLTFWGNRRCTFRKGSNADYQPYVWRSSWARVCTADNRVRVEYQIHKDAWYDGFINVGFQDGQPDIMQGIFFFHLPPDTVSGSIRFKRATADIQDDVLGS
jgi:hypothetical protein